MAHIRIRKFNTRDAYPEQKLDNDLSMVVRAGNHIFLRGQTAMDLDGRAHQRVEFHEITASAAFPREPDQGGSVRASCPPPGTRPSGS